MHRNVRKVVTVLFADVSGSTAFGEDRDPEVTRAFLARYFAAMRTAIEGHGGTVEKFIGDAVMAVFGIPVAHEDDALRAVRAATDMTAALEGLNRALGARIRVRMGINSGEVVAGAGSGETLVTGDAVNVAARLEQAARPGEVLLGETTLRLARGAVEVGPPLTLELKGKTALVDAYRLLGLAVPRDFMGRDDQTPFIGRDREVTVLRETFAQVESAEEPWLVAVVGTPGVGKSRLVREFVAEASARARVLRGRCLPYGQGITFWPIAEIVRQAVGIDEADTAEVARARLREALDGMPDAAHVAVALERLLGLAAGGSPVEELAWATRRLFERLAAASPLAVTIEDVHWAEAALLDLIDHVIAIGRGPIMVMAPTRPEIRELRRDFLAGDRRRHLALEPLAEDATTQLIERLLPGEEQIPALRERIAEAADGNPLYVEELVAMLVDGGSVQRAGDRSWTVSRSVERIAMPPTISALLAARLDHLGPERTVAERGAVVGRVFGYRAVAHLSPDIPSEALDDRLDTLVGRDLVRPESTSVTEELAYRFRHILIRDAAYASLPKSERARLHENLATWLEAVAGDRVAEIEEIVGYHQEQAITYLRELGTAVDDAALASKASGHLATAGRRALDRGDVLAAVSLLERAAALLPSDEPGRGTLLIDLSIALYRSGAVARSHELLTRVIDQASSSGDAATRLHGTVVRWDIGDLSSENQEAIRRDARQAIDVLATAGDELGAARAWGLLLSSHWYAGEGAAAERCVSNSLAHARRSGRRGELIRCYEDMTAILNTGPTPVDEGIERCHAILARESDDRMVEAWMSHALAHLEAKRGSFAVARAQAALTRRVLEENGQTLDHAVMAELVADVEYQAGDPTAAMRILAEGLDTYHGLGRESAILSAHLSHVAWHAGEPEVVEACADEGMSAGGWTRGLTLGSLARLRASQGRFEEAERLVREALGYWETTDFLTYHGWTLEALGDVMAMAQRGDEAIAAYDQAAELHRRKGSTVGVAKVDSRVAQIKSAT